MKTLVSVASKNGQSESVETQNTLRSECETLTQQRDYLKQEIITMQERHNREVEKKYNEIRQKQTEIEAQRTKLEQDKKSFESILMQFKKEKESFDHEKQILLDLKTEATKTMERAGEFIRMVRDGAAKL